MNMQRISLDQVHIGSALPWNVYDSNGLLIMSKGFVIEKNVPVSSLIQRGMFIEVDPDIDNEARKAGKNVTLNPFSVLDEIQTELNLLFRNIEFESDTQNKFVALTKRIQKICEHDPDACLGAIMLFDNQRYALNHMIHVALVCEIVARRLEWPTPRRISLIGAALTMNLAMLDLQTMLHTQSTPLIEEQKTAIRKHPEATVEMLKKAGVTDSAWLRAVLEHHESPNGQGYPKGLTDISPLAQLIRLADIYTAKLCESSFRKAEQPNQIQKNIYLEEQNNPMVALLIKEIGIYPPGTLVRLSNNETGMVIKRGESATTPLVSCFADEFGYPYKEPISRITKEKNYTVAAVLGRDKIVIPSNHQSLWGY